MHRARGLHLIALPLAAALCASGAALAQPATPPAATASAAPPPAYISIVQEIHIDRDPATVWKRVGGFCDLGAWMKTTCVYTQGEGGLGTNRLIAGRINEVMVAKTSTSYSYAQPGAPNLYHGTFEVLPDASGSKIIYTLFYDVAPVGDAAARTGDAARRRAMFAAALKSMKALAEAP